MTIGEKFKKMRKNKGFSKYQLHTITNISENHINSIESGSRNPSVRTLERLIEPMGITMAELFNADAESFYLSDIEKALIMNFRTMSDEKSKIFFEMGRILNE